MYEPFDVVRDSVFCVVLCLNSKERLTDCIQNVGENCEVGMEKLPSDAAEFYDPFSTAWEQDGGEHLHVVFYDVPSPPDNLLDDKAAAVRMVEEALRFVAIFG